MSSIDEIKKKKLEELQKKNAEQQANQNFSQEDLSKLQQEIDAIEHFVKQKFTREAYTRYTNLKSAHPQKALQLITILAQIIQNGSLQAQITDEQLKGLLEKMSVKRDFKITRK